MIWQYLDVPERKDFPVLLEASQPFNMVLPNVSLKLRREEFSLYYFGMNDDDAVYRDTHREIFLSPRAASLRLAFAHEMGHLLYQYGLSLRQQEGRWRDAITETESYQYLTWVKSDEQVLWLRLDSQGEMEESYEAADLVHINYLLLWDELFARATAQYVAQASGDEEMMNEIEVRTRPGVGYPFYPQHWLHADFAPVYETLHDLFGELGWRGQQ